MRADPSSERALRFSSLVGKLGGQQVLKQRWAILYFLYSIGQDATSQQWELPSNVEDVGERQGGEFM